MTFFPRADDTIDIGGIRMVATKKFRNVEAGPRVAFVVDVVGRPAAAFAEGVAGVHRSPPPGVRRTR